MTAAGGPLTVRFLVSNNLPVSISRVTAVTATELVRRGVSVTVLYPLVDWLDYKLFQLGRGGLGAKVKGVVRLLRDAVRSVVVPQPWCGYRSYGADARIRSVSYVLTPPWTEGRPNEVMIVQHPYVIPHLLRGLGDHRARVVGVVWNNYERELQSPLPEQAAWKRHTIAIERMLAIPRVAVSEGARQAAERLGIRVNGVITNGMDLARFRPPAQRRDGRPLTVTVFCATAPQKGQRVGAEAARLVKAELGESVRIGSVGDVLPECRDAFDVCYGYLHGEAYVRAIQATDVFVYPSLFDGFPAPPLEAMACGCAVVTTAVEGVTEYAVDGENCLVCAPGDVAALTAGIVRLIRDEPLRRRLKANGPPTAAAYAIERKAEELLEFLQSLQQMEQADEHRSAAAVPCAAA